MDPGYGCGEALDAVTRRMKPAVPRPLRIAVVGAAEANEREVATAEALGAALAQRGAVVVCGGRSGVMEAVARGAASCGGLTVGILPGGEAEGANAWIGLPVPTGMGEARNALIVRAAQAVVGVGGAWGTLSEIALAKKIGRPVAILGPPPAEGLGLTSLDTPEEAADWACSQAVRRS
jgi:uncharacterized protein (TIGR00725 family)